MTSSAKKSMCNLTCTLRLVAAVGLLTAGTAAAADAARGEKLHQACLQCHGTELYTPERHKVGSLRALRKEVERWNDYYNPKMSKGCDSN